MWAPNSPLATTGCGCPRRVQQLSNSSAASAGGRGGGKPGAVALAGVGRQRELGHQQQAAAGVPQRQVHAPGGVGEHAIVEQPLQQALDRWARRRRARRRSGPARRRRSRRRPRPSIPRTRAVAHALDQGDHAVANPRLSPYTLPPFSRALCLFCRGVRLCLPRCAPGSASSACARPVRRRRLAQAAGRCRSAASSWATPASAATASTTTRTSTRPTACRELVGQHPEYLVAALKAYRSKERSHAHHARAGRPALRPGHAKTSPPTSPAAALAAGAPAPARRRPRSPKLCVACHGKDGVGITVDYPTLAGQHADYLARALDEYKQGDRKNAIMPAFAAQLSDADIKAIAEYYAAQRPALQTVPRRITVLAAK